MATQISRLLRYATRGARGFAEQLGRRQVSNYCSRGSGGFSGARTFSSGNRDGFLENDSFAGQAEPLPALALAYDYDDEEWEDESSDLPENNSDSHFNRLAQHAVKHDVTGQNIHYTPLASAAGGLPPGRAGGPSASTPYPSPSSMVSGKGRHAGGGGNGRHRCPKCGTTVTFRCDFEENTFYCASCSGWFVVSPSTFVAGEEEIMQDGSPYEEFMAKNGSHNTADPEILMRHVSPITSMRVV